MNLIRLEGAGKTYASESGPVAALRKVDLDLEAGQFVAVVGRSGCGKSTLLNLCGAMDFPTEGRVLIEGASTADLDEAALTALRRSKIGFVFQFFQLLPTMTAEENVELPALLAGNTHARSRSRELLGWVELEGLGARYPHQLSGGQMQRVAIARALINSPRVILADEPIGNLDTVTGDTVLELLRRTAKEIGALVVMATHSLESAEKCDVVVRMKDGGIDHVERR
ncbi:MAG: ABC transporter ATP-binding protein [Bryobacteraceae bacterium]